MMLYYKPPCSLKPCFKYVPVANEKHIKMKENNHILFLVIPVLSVATCTFTEWSSLMLLLYVRVVFHMKGYEKNLRRS